MLTWLSANLSTLLISLVLFAVVIPLSGISSGRKSRVSTPADAAAAAPVVPAAVTADGKHSQEEQAHGTSRAPVPIIVDWFAGWSSAPQKDQILTIFPVFHASVVA